MKFSFCNKRVLAQNLGCSHHTVKSLRQRGDLIEEIHYIRENSRTIRYNLELCLNWFANRHNPDAHQKAIDQYLASLEETGKYQRTRQKSSIK